MNESKEASGSRKPYSPPALVVYGTITELTLGANAAVGDGFGGNTGTGSVNPPGLPPG